MPSEFEGPSRLVHIGNPEHRSSARLVEVSALRKLPRYIALSYCWGPAGSMRLTTTIETEDERLSGLVNTTIPRTFADAFTVARALRFDYIWIDALCIIQDDPKDWEREASKMGDIYQNASLTIAASRAESTNDGFLARETLDVSARIPFNSKIHPSIRGYFNVSYLPDHRNSDLLETEFSKWNERGWTFQERLLSRRIILFGKRQLTFECRKSRRLENYDGEIKRPLAILKHLRSTNEWDVLRMSWLGITEQYCARQFTFDKDRLLALASIAREILIWLRRNQQQSTVPRSAGSQYLAGHWWDGIELSLVWFTQSRGNRFFSRNAISDSWRQERRTVDVQLYSEDFAHVPSNSQPSWSWVSRSSSSMQILWPRLDRNETLESVSRPVDATITLSGYNPLGAVSAGTLTMEGFVAPIRFKESFQNRADAWHSTTLSLFWGFEERLNVAFDVSSLVDSENIYWLAFLCTSARGARHQKWYGIVMGLVGSGESPFRIKRPGGLEDIWDAEKFEATWELLAATEPGRSFCQPFRRLGVFFCGIQTKNDDYSGPRVALRQFDPDTFFMMKKFLYTII